MGQKAYERGMKTRRKVLGDEWVDRAEKSKTPFNEEFQDLITRYAWDEVWNRPRLPHKARRILVLGTMVALGRWEEFQMHVRAALRSGELEADDIKEILLQQAIYCGVPAANTAFKEARAVLDELKAKPRKKGRK
ncbi:MAG TPA: 4-carboxymuconolactone decarboxylase [Usitatibacter sp.]|nr:4-carboxymuconolactone decarboxylase [Usitatibacter sp.]